MPDAKPSAFITRGYLDFSMKMLASFFFEKTPKFAVGILYFLHIFFVKIFDPSSCDAIWLGPNTLILCLSKKSTIPSTSGFSGPTTTKSIFCLRIKFLSEVKFFRFIFIFVANFAVPAFPGKQ